MRYFVSGELTDGTFTPIGGSHAPLPPASSGALGSAPNAQKQSHASDPFLRRPPASVRSFAARTGDLLFVSGIPGFDDKGALADGFEQFGFVVITSTRAR